MIKSTYTFDKKERLCSKLIIDRLFNQDDVGKIHNYPIVLIYLKTELPAKVPAQVLISVGKKRFKKAVERNKIKRQLREIYRLHKNRLYEVLEPEKEQLALLLLFSGKEIFDYHQLNTRFEEAFEQLITSL